VGRRSKNSGIKIQDGGLPVNEIEYARNYLGTFKTKGDEIIPVLCPFCKGGDHQDKYTFALNMENHTFNCRRGSCGKTGHFSELLKEIGEKYEDSEKTYVKKPKSYKPSNTHTVPPTDKTTAYLISRKIKPETAQAYGVCSDSSGNMVFPFYRTSEDKEQSLPTFLKFRKPEKITDGRKMWREADTEPILFGLHLCDKSKPLLYITEGEFDCMAVYQASEGMINVVSVPSGSQDFTWIETCEEQLSAYKYIAVIGDNDAPGQKMLADISAKMADKIVLAPDFPVYRGAKDANEILFRYGTDGILAVISSMKPIPVEGLINLADVRTADLSSIPRTLSGIPTLDKVLGGFIEGDLTIWTGKRGEGKSSVLNQIALESIERGTNTCIYSGEVPAERLKYFINLCAAGSLNVDSRPDILTGRELFYVSREKAIKIESWYDRKIWLYDNKIIKVDERDSVLQKFTEAFSRYDCRVFIVDNLMTVSTGAKANEVMQLQADFVVRLRKFAEKYGVHVHCVVHPRKTPSVSDSDEVGGMGTITNIACNVLTVHKCDEKEQHELNSDAVIGILKNRAHGERSDILLNYNQGSRRYTEKHEKEREYSWHVTHWEEITDDKDIP
jgi:twinkle protein